MDRHALPEETAEALLNETALPEHWRSGVRPGLQVALAALAAERDLSGDGRARALAQFRDNLRRLGAIAADDWAGRGG